MLKVIIISAAVLAAIVCIACNDEPDVQQEYDFRLECWHLPDETPSEGDVEMRFTLVRDGDYTQASYNIGYIQLKGEGEVRDASAELLVNREERPLAGVPGLDRTDRLRQVFTLYYRDKTDKAASLRFFVRDNFGRQRILDISLQGITSNQQSPE